MSFRPRVPVSFESIDGSVSFTFPEAEYEWESAQELHAPEVTLTGVSYGYDQLGVGAPVKQSGDERIRFVIYGSPTDIDTVVAEMQSECYSIGRGYLIAEDSTSTEYRAMARIRAMPVTTWSADDLLRVTVSIVFRRHSDWEEVEEP